MRRKVSKLAAPDGNERHVGELFDEKYVPYRPSTVLLIQLGLRASRCGRILASSIRPLSKAGLQLSAIAPCKRTRRGGLEMSACIWKTHPLRQAPSRQYDRIEPGCISLFEDELWLVRHNVHRSFNIPKFGTTGLG